MLVEGYTNLIANEFLNVCICNVTPRVHIIDVVEIDSRHKAYHLFIHLSLIPVALV